MNERLLFHGRDKNERATFGWIREEVSQPPNPTTYGGSSWVTKFLTHLKVSRVELIIF